VAAARQQGRSSKINLRLAVGVECRYSGVEWEFGGVLRGNMFDIVVGVAVSEGEATLSLAWIWVP
jgi:hypothetical protein